MSEQQEITRWGWLAQFDGPEKLLAAADTLRRESNDAQPHEERKLVPVDAFAPFPVEGLEEAVGFRPSTIPWIILAGGLLGGAAIYILMYWINLYAYPLNVGGRPLHSWPAFIPPTFECIVLGASLFAIGGLLKLCGLPRLRHPVFEVEAFRRASTDGFFLAIQSEREGMTTDEVEQRLKDLGAMHTWEVPDV